MHRGIAPLKVMHEEHRKGFVHILYFTYIFFDCPRIKIYMISISLNSWTYFISSWYMCSSVLGALQWCLVLRNPSVMADLLIWQGTMAGELPVLCLTQWALSSFIGQWSLRNKHCVNSPGVDNLSSSNRVTGVPYCNRTVTSPGVLVLGYAC